MEWNDIGTAPKNDFIVGRDGGFVCTIMWRESAGGWVAPTATGFQKLFEPAFWLPLKDFGILMGEPE